MKALALFFRARWNAARARDADRVASDTLTSWVLYAR